jgi:hypothetical protein
MTPIEDLASRFVTLAIGNVPKQERPSQGNIPRRSEAQRVGDYILSLRPDGAVEGPNDEAFVDAASLWRSVRPTA